MSNDKIKDLAEHEILQEHNPHIVKSLHVHGFFLILWNFHKEILYDVT